MKHKIERPIFDEHWCCGLWLKLAVPTGEWQIDRMGRRRAVKRKQKRVMLTALGVYGDGHWEILTWQLANTEDAAAWRTFLGDLYVKGITEQSTELVVSDGAKGLAKALYSHSPGVPHQRCIFHKIKNIADYLQYAELMVAASGVIWSITGRTPVIEVRV